LIFPAVQTNNIEKQFTEFLAFNRADTMNTQQTVTGLGKKNGHLNQGFI